MRGVELVVGGVTILLILIGATIAPYLGLYVLRRRQRASCAAVLLAVVIDAAFGLGVGLAIQDALIGVLAVPAIQAAVDAQCGLGTETVTSGGFESQPYYTWLGEDAGCQYLNDAGWECYCAVEEP